MALHGVDISRTPSAGALVFEALRRAIIEGELRDGDPIRQDEIARLFNTSRIPVREAIARLEQHGLVKTHRFKGAVVAGLSIAEAGEIFDFRCLVEAQVIRRAVPRMTPVLIEDVRAICCACEAATDPIRWGDLNRQFHATLYQSSDLPFHLAALDNAMDRLDRYLRARLLLTDGYARANAEHRGIVDACALGDANAAEVLTIAHIQGAHAALREHLGRIKRQSDHQVDGLPSSGDPGEGLCPLPTRDLRQRVAHPVHAAALPGPLEHPGDGGLPAGVSRGGARNGPGDGFAAEG